MPVAVTTNSTPIDRREKLTYQEFVTEYLYPHKPVIISGALTGWRALFTWTPSYFKDKYGTYKVSVDGKEYGERSAFEFARNEGPIAVRAVQPSEFLCIVLPRF